jgi:hypothetical protein
MRHREIGAFGRGPVPALLFGGPGCAQMVVAVDVYLGQRKTAPLVRL